ncbi:MAG: hypothetical protein KatS3mg105_3572 [Gemmatales bacterium]|nr:MAG: hypothetical protein KatS3mg105_3572 [Gemmatales bacterium]
MPLIKCPQCQSFFVSPEQVGERFSCSHCGARLRRQNGNVKRTTTSLKTSPTQPSPTAALQGASVADKPRSKLFVAGIVGIAALVIVGIGLGLAFFVIQSESNPAADHLQAESESPSAEPVTQPATQPQGSNGQPTQPITPPQGSNGQPTQPATPPQGSNGQPTQPATQPQGSNGQPTQPATPPQGSNGQPTPPIQVAHRPLSGDEIYRRLARSAVWILAYDSFEQLAGFGTGALIQEKRKLVLTAYHVIDDASSVFVVFPVFGDEGVPIADVKYYANNFDKLKIRGKVVCPGFTTRSRPDRTGVFARQCCPASFNSSKCQTRRKTPHHWFLWCQDF